MSIIELYVVPIVKTTMFLGFGSLFLYGIYRATRSIFPKEFKSWFKYDILRMKVDEEKVRWCLTAYENGADEVLIEKHLRLNNVSTQRVEDLLFIFKKIVKMKGGNANNVRQIKASPIQDFPRR